MLNLGKNNNIKLSLDFGNVPFLRARARARVCVFINITSIEP
jgi:hypothetical protein